MSDLAGFLLARLVEDEAAARAAAQVVPNGEGWYRVAQEAIADPEFSRRYGHAYVHIARHDPARVLAEVAAKRRIVELHAAKVKERNCSECGQGTVDWGPSSPGDFYPVEWPCPTLHLLAQPYADHPDFDPAWKVEP